MTIGLVLVNETREMLLAGSREQLNTLNGAITDTTGTSVTVTYDLGGILEGAVIEVDNELMRVIAADTTTKVATVIRGYGNSTAATHATGAQVTVNPKFSRQAIFSAINDGLDDLSGEGLYQMVTTELTYNSAVQGYNITGMTGAEELYQVTYQDVGPAKAWPIVPSIYTELRPNAETDDFTSGFALIVTGYAQPGRQLRVMVKSPFTRLTAFTDDINTAGGLPATCNRLVKYSAGMQLVGWREVLRNAFESQGDTRRAEEIPQGAQVSAARVWQVQYDRGIQNESNSLKRRYPERRW